MNRWQIGNVRVARVVEVEGPMPGTFLFATGEPENILAHPWLAPHFATAEGQLIGAIQALVVESGGRRIVVDTCVGNDKERPLPNWNKLQGRFLEDLAEAGFPRDSIDTVLCTHLHVDHVGWNTMLVDGRWVPTFENARYLFGREEWDYWSTVEAASDGDVIGDSVRPVVEAGLCDLVEADQRLTDEVWLEPSHGHTPGHMSVRIRSQGEEAVITGDLLHHPIQCAEPDWVNNFDIDPDAARATRRAFMERHADGPVLVIGTHFPTPTAGRVVSGAKAWRFEV